MHMIEEGKLEFEKLLAESVRSHGHLCPGQVLGVKMSLRGLSEIGIGDPKCRERKDFMVIVEMNSCVFDAVQSVTGCSPGRRTLRLMDYGKMAMTLVNLKTGRSVRLLAREDSRKRAKEYAPEIEDVYAAQCEAYKVMSDEELFEVTYVEVLLRPEDIPGRPLRRIRCDSCGEQVQDMREICREGKVLCKPCADGGYYFTK
ncbi:MAG TPA: FmdE family protein [Nitrospirota bacterium]|nr:FmdE family protein [Nitrospirota bacterium]